jgi:hypothetical protein
MLTSEPAGDRVYFLLKDPHWTFLWWELSPETVRRVVEEEMGGDASQAQLWLRIHDVTDILFNGENSHSYFDVEVRGVTDHWYLHLAAAGRVYCAEVGFKTAGQRFHPAARSKPVFLPREGPSDCRDERWSDISLC